MFSFLFILIIGVIVWLGVSYNKLQKFAQEIREKSSNIQVSISKKLALINQLIDLVKGYQESEQLVHLKISQDINATSIMSSYQQTGTVLASVQGMADRYPDLKVSGHYHQLMENISSCEQNIQKNREVYNYAVKNYNVARLTIPVVFVANAIGFPEAPYMEFDLSGVQDATRLKEFKTDDGERLKQLFSNAGSQIAGATRTIANQAVSSGKMLGSRLMDNKQTTSYFYMSPGGIPKGPTTSHDLLQLLEVGAISTETMVAVSGSEEWQSIDILKAQPISENPPISEN